MEAKTVGGYDAYVYPSEPDDKTLKGCVILRGRNPWDSGEWRKPVQWDFDGTCIFYDRFGGTHKDSKFTDWDLIVEKVEKEETNVEEPISEENCSRPRSFWRSLWDRWMRA